MKRFVLWCCPGCGASIKARGATDVFHECGKRQNRLTAFRSSVLDPSPNQRVGMQPGRAPSWRSGMDSARPGDLYEKRRMT